MGRKRQHKCKHCGQPFRTFYGLQIHTGHMHGGAPLAARPPPQRGGPAPIPPPFPPMHGVEEADGVAPMDADSDDGGHAHEDGAAEEGGDPAVAEARAYARRMLRAPGWEQWAEDMLAWCEVNHLDGVEKLFPEEEDFVTPETYRYLRLFHQHPGASFASELLKADQKEPLDLSQVAKLARICGAFVHLLVYYDSNITGILHAYVRHYDRHMPGI